MLNQQTNKKIFPFLIGTDPEFLILYGNSKLNAEKTISLFLKENIENITEKTALGYKIPNIGEIGWDGRNETGEIRPLPSNDPQIVTRNIKTLFDELIKKAPFLDLSTLSLNSPIGGHIHLDLTEEIYQNTRKKNNAIKILSTFLIPIMLSDHKLCSMNRYKESYGEYGSLSNVRTDIKNTNSSTPRKPTIEIRGLSAEWTTTQEITYATLCYIGVIWNEIIKKNNELIKLPSIFKTIRQIEAIQEIIYANYTPIEKIITEQIKKTITTFELYPTFKNEIDFILNTKKVLETKQKIGWNIGIGWNLQKKENPKFTKKDFLSERKIQKLSKETNLELIKDNLSIAYNDDFNITQFTDALTIRIATLKLKLKNRYLIFGIKKGSNEFLITDQKDQIYSSNKNLDKTSIIDVHERMKNKILNQTRHNEETITINSDGTINDHKNPYYLIGIPYDLRAEKKTQPFLNLIWNLEKNKIKPLTKIHQIPENNNKNEEKKLNEYSDEFLNTQNNGNPAILNIDLRTNESRDDIPTRNRN